MADISTLFFDLGGVILTNGWDRDARHRAMDHFELDWDEFRDRHDFVADAFETGELTRDDYLTRTVFYRDRPFTRDDFISFMEAQSELIPETMDVIDKLVGRFQLMTLNNESKELNEYRIHQFGLKQRFSGFLSSCYLGVKKPEERIYHIALEVTQADPKSCIFVDDRDLNVECGALVGLNTIHFESPQQLQSSLADLGVET